MPGSGSDRRCSMSTTGVVRRACRDCRVRFEISGEVREKYSRPGWTLPVRCEVCRQKRRLRGAGLAAVICRCETCGRDFAVGEDAGAAKRKRCHRCRTKGRVNEWS